jgi:hypothetical protein
MLQLIVILAVAFIIAPLIDLFGTERTQTIWKAVVYIITLLWLVGVLFFNRGAF